MMGVKYIPTIILSKTAKKTNDSLFGKRGKIKKLRAKK
jgi:hypothetical protein